MRPVVWYQLEKIVSDGVLSCDAVSFLFFYARFHQET